MSSTRISAVVCTRDRRHYLAHCLSALQKQTLHPSIFDVIIVDNGSTDDTHNLAQRYCARNDNFRYVHENRTGLAIARNTGIRASSSDIIAFTDDDAVPDPTWLARLLDRFDTYHAYVGIVGGDVTPIWEAARPEWLDDALLRPLSAGLKWSTEPRFLRPGEWLVEVNSAYHRSALARIGGFPEHLGRVGDTLLSGEGGINILIQRAGFGLFYDPAILVQHHIPASRLTKSWFRRRSFWQGVSMNLLTRYIDEMAQKLSLPASANTAQIWEEIRVPVSPSAWADLFDDRSRSDFTDQLYVLEQLGYLLESQAVVIGR